MLLEEITKDTVKKWKPTGLLEGIKNKYDKMITAVVMDTQRLYTQNNDYTDTDDFALFKRISIPLVRRVIPQLITNRIASVQPFLLKNDKLSYRYTNANGSWMREEDVEIKERKYKVKWSFEGQASGRIVNGLDAEVELCAVLAQEIGLELDRLVLAELQQGASTQNTWDFNDALGDTIMEKYEGLYVKLVGVQNAIKNKLGAGEENGYYWIVTSYEIASIFESATAGFAPTLGIQYCGTINMKWRLYKDPLFTANEILMGYRGDSPYESGFFFCPHILLQQTPVFLDPDSFMPRKGLLGKWGHKMVNPDYYATLKMENFVV